MAETRLIDGNKAEAVLRNIADHLKEAGKTDLWPATYAAADVIKQQPTIDPESLRPESAWVVERWPSGWIKQCNCQSCGNYPRDAYKPDRFCSRCGAKMTVTDNERLIKTSEQMIVWEG